MATRQGFAGEATAPEIDRPGLQWFNVPAPLPIDSLRGRVVILDFWTEGCINCIHIIPTLRRIEERFPEQVAVIGVHSPKFPNERDPASVADAIQRYEIRHPIVHDPKLTIWQAYGVQAWPTLVVINTDGTILGQIAGEPDPDQALKAIGDLVDRSAQAGSLRPRRLDLAVPVEPRGKFLFPGKLKPLPGPTKEWVLADGGHHQIVVLGDDGGERHRYGSGEAGLVDGTEATARFNHPQGVAASAEAIFVADTDNHAIRRIDRASGAITTLAGTGKRGKVLTEPADALGTALASPWDLEVAGTTLYFANAGTHQLGALDLGSGQVRRFVGSGEEALTPGDAATAAMAQPSGLALSADRRTLYVADSESSAIRAVSLGDTTEIGNLVGAGLFDFGWVNGALKTARLQHPLGVAEVEGVLLVADTYNNAIRAIDLGRGQVADFDGGAFTCTDPICVPAREPAGIVADGPDRILLVDTGNHRIEEYRPSTKTYRTWAR
ncbi:MAG TPA: thioredoxin-like domain-containing protein [Stellaceae bacterium]|nr:thioredoxin-like domain-containing protein [Stellaceae bacterium]